MQPVGLILPRALAAIVRQAPLSQGKIDFAWRTTVGSALAKTTEVRLDAGILYVEAQDARWAAAVMGASRIILARMQALLGEEHVHDVRVRR